MILRTEAITLRSIKFGESSQITTFLTRDRGRLAVIAKGARRMKSRFGSTLQPMSHAQVLVYYKSTRTLHILKESSLLSVWSGIGNDLKRLTAGLRMVELVNVLLQEEERNDAVFVLLLDVLRHLDEAEQHPEPILPFFQLQLAGALGFTPRFERAHVEALEDEGGYLLLPAGDIVKPDAHGPAARRASRAALRAFSICARAPLSTVVRMRLHATVLHELEQLVEAYLRYHVEEAYPTRSAEVFRRLSDASR